MAKGEKKGTFDPSEVSGQWAAKKQRDDTPSFIRNVSNRAQMLNPNRDGIDSIPVLAMPSSVKIWRKVRVPLFITVVVVLLGTLFWFTYSQLVARNVSRRIEDARVVEYQSRLEDLVESHASLLALAERHQGHANVQAAFAWQSILLAQLTGSQDKYLSPAADAIRRLESDSTPQGLAVRAGAALVAGNVAGATDIASKGLEANPSDLRLMLAKAWALRQGGDTSGAANLLKEASAQDPTYLPVLHTALFYAFEDADHLEIARLSRELLTASGGDLLGFFGSVDARLPRWGEPEPATDRIAEVLLDMETQSSRIASAPPSLRKIGGYLAGRVSLLAGKLEEAVAALEVANGGGDSQEVLSWYAEAIRRQKGPAAALAVLKDAGEDPPFAILELRTRCYLDYYQVDKAREALAAIGSAKDASAADLDALKWIFHVRSGDTQGAKGLLPPKIDSRNQWVALEYYDLLRQAGDIDAINVLADHMSGGAEKCADLIRIWHGRNVEAMIPAMAESDPCAAALSARLLRGHILPEELRQAASRASKASDGNLRVQVDRALAEWLTQGKQAALPLLAAVMENHPQGAPLLQAVSSAYASLGEYEKALETLDGLEDPVSVSLRLAALQGLGQGSQVEKILEDAGKNPELKDHPAILVWILADTLDRKDLDAVVTGVDAAIDTAGMWSAELAELKAKAQNAMGSRGDADRSLAAVSKTVKSTVGFDESWQADIAIIRLNLRRGGSYLYKAVGVTLELYKSGVKDAEVAYSYAVANIRQGNERGAMKYLRESVEYDPSFIPTYSQLSAMNKLTEEYQSLLDRTIPGAQL